MGRFNSALYYIMNTRLFFIILLLSVFADNCSFAQDPNQWSNAWAPHFRHLNAVEILPNGKFVAVGGWPSNDSITTIVTSTDTAATWNIIVDSPMAPMLQDLDFTSNTTGYVVGWSGEIRKTVDGGDNWSQITVPGNPGTRNYMACHFFDDMSGIVVGGHETMDSIQTILKTIDGGANWTIASDNLGSYLRSVHFVDNSIGFAVGDDGTILKTINGGDNWTPQSVSGSIQSRMLNDVYFIDQNIGIAVGGWPSNDSIQTILKTTDGGANWNIVTDNLSPMLNAVHFFSATQGYAVGNDGAVLYTNDSGSTWQNQIIPNNDTYHIYDVFFLNAAFGLTGGNSGKLLWYVDTTSLSINQIDLKSTIVYPNITDGLFTIEFNKIPSNSVDIQVVDMTGKSVYKESVQLDKNKVLIDLSNNKPQYYIVIIGEGNNVHTFKILLK